MSPISLKSLPGVAVLERGWLSSNNVVLHGGADDGGATLVDTGHCTHAALTVALVRQALREPTGEDAPLRRLVNTHLHSDHCGGNAALQAAFPGLQVDVPAGRFDAVRAWDEAALGYRATGQRCARFAVHGSLEPGTPLVAGSRRWEVIASPGHDPDAVMLFDARDGILISADALWHDGFGVVFPELDGRAAFDDAGAVFDTIERLGPACVIPGHGAPFDDVDGALARARQRLASWQSDPLRHARHAARVLIKYHLMEEREQARPSVLDWAQATPLMQSAWRTAGRHEEANLRDWVDRLVSELVARGALAQDGTVVRDA